MFFKFSGFQISLREDNDVIVIYTSLKSMEVKTMSINTLGILAEYS